MSTYITNRPLEFDGAPDWLVSYMRYRLSVLGNSKTAVMTYFLSLTEFCKWFSYFHTTGKNPKDSPSLRSVDILELPLEDMLLVSKGDIQSFLYFATDVLGNQPATRKKKLAAICGLYEYLIDQQNELGIEIEVNPTSRIIRPKTPKKQPVYLTQEEQIEFLRVIENNIKDINHIRDYAMFLLMLCTGLRLSEVVTIRMKDINLNTCCVNVHGKGNKERPVIFTDSCKCAIEEYLNIYRNTTPGLTTDKLFVSKLRKKELTARNIQLQMDKYLRMANLGNKSLSPHKLRHTTATMLAKDGTDLAIIQDLLGHENANTTKIYTHLDGSDIAKAISASRLSELGSHTVSEKAMTSRKESL